jgi:UDP-N-acetylglucosamine 2-epimerase (non-hydrolysing)
MKKVVTVVGARPQLIKEAVLCKEIELIEGMSEVLVHTGQHYDQNMSGRFFESLNIKKPDYNLGIGSGSHAHMTGKIMMAFEEVVLKENPDAVAVYGDTNSTIAAALVASKLNIPVVHIEAGLRQNPKQMPEEINRVLTDRISNSLLCPSELAVENLHKEGITEGVYNTGDIMFDLYCKLKQSFSYELFENLKLKEEGYAVMTLHRDFNVDSREALKAILKGIEQISKDISLIFPIHPRTRNRIGQFGFESIIKNVKLVDPIDYLELMGLVSRSAFVITDSGGLQKEAYFAGKRSLVVMEDTSWRELTDSGWNLLCSGWDMYEKSKQIEKHVVSYRSGIYGDGNAAKNMVNIMSHI